MYGTYGQDDVETLPVARPVRSYICLGALWVIAVPGPRVEAVAVFSREHGKFLVMSLGESMPRLDTMNARWTGRLPKVGEYLKVERAARCAYRIVRDVREHNVIPEDRDDDEMVDIAICVERVELPVPEGAVVYPWHWSRPGKNRGWVHI